MLTNIPIELKHHTLRDNYRNGGVMSLFQNKPSKNRLGKNKQHDEMNSMNSRGKRL